MKDSGKMIIYGAGILVAGILSGTLLMIAVYCLPVAPMKANAQRSTEIYDYEGVYPQLMWGYKMSQLDNCTDATMLLNAIYSGPGSPVEKAMQVYRTEYYGENPVKSLTNYANDVEAETYGCAYSRYWHGYLVILKPLLLFWDVADIRMMNMFLQITLPGYLLLLMKQKGYGRYIAGFLFSVLLLNPAAISVSFQFSTVYYLMLSGSIFILKHGTLSRKRCMFLFLISGMATAFFDFLTYPLATLCFPLLFLLLKEESWKEAFKKVICYSLIWGIGYIGMWCGKWTIGSILLHRNLWTDALYRAAEYESMEYEDGKVHALQVILKNLSVLMKWPILLGCMAVFIFHIKQFCRKGADMVADLPQRCLRFIPFGLIALMPFAWYLAAGTHSYIHYWFTYRELCISVFALPAGLTKCLLVNEKRST